MAYEIANDIGTPELIRPSTEILYRLHEERGDNANALSMFELYILMKDSLVNLKNTRVLLQGQYQYEYELQAFSDSVKNVELNKIKDARLMVQDTLLIQ